MQNGTDAEDDEAPDREVIPPEGYPYTEGVELAEQRRAWILDWLSECGGPQMKARDVVKDAAEVERYLVGEKPALRAVQ